DPLSGFLRSVLLDPAIGLPFLRCRASVSHHHADVGGLLMHSTEMLDLAAEAGKPVVIHQRDAGGDLLEVLDASPRVPTMLHCFSGGGEFAKAAVSRKLHCSFAGNLTFRSAADLREAVLAVPTALLLLETDSPFLAPHPLRGRLCHPALVRLTASWLASHLGVGLELVAERSSSTARAFFQLPSP
ncbi:MAG: TatD family hydrolase, partial [Candidatus Dormibacteria bacterium]